MSTKGVAGDSVETIADLEDALSEFKPECQVSLGHGGIVIHDENNLHAGFVPLSGGGK
jgi:hypothetical protein